MLCHAVHVSHRFSCLQASPLSHDGIPHFGGWVKFPTQPRWVPWVLDVVETPELGRDLGPQVEGFWHFLALICVDLSISEPPFNPRLISNLWNPIFWFTTKKVVATHSWWNYVKLQLSDEKSIDGSSALNGFLITSPLNTPCFDDSRLAALLQSLLGRSKVGMEPGGVGAQAYCIFHFFFNGIIFKKPKS